MPSSTKHAKAFGILLTVTIAAIGALGTVLMLQPPHPAHANASDLTDAEQRYPTIIGSQLDTCELCHNPPPNQYWNRNTYGGAYGRSGYSFAAIEAADSDHDGVSNLDEITMHTMPGDPNSKPHLAYLPITLR
jgi:hypothetical protein